MSNRIKNLPYYVFFIGTLLISIGFNFVQYEEIKLLREEKAMYRVFFEYLYLKLEAIEKINKDFVYKELGA